MDEFLSLMRMSILAAMPQTFCYFVLAFSILAPNSSKVFKRLAILAILHSLYTDIFQLILPLLLHLVNSWIGQIILLFILFRELKVKQKILIFLLTNFLFFCFDLINILLAQHLLGITDRESLLHDKFLESLPLLYTSLAVILVASWFIRHRTISLSRHFSSLLEGDPGTITKLIMLILIQFFLLGSLQFVDFANEQNENITKLIITYLIIGISLTLLFFTFKLLIRTREQAIQSTQAVYVEDINQMFASIRGQRHDFINHLQVIHSMSQMGKIPQLQQYVSELVQETKEMSEIVNHQSPALAAFIKAKTAVAVAKGIAFSFELPSDAPSTDTSIRTIDMIKILGNLVDNAFDAVILLPPGKRVVHASITYEETHSQMEVTNGGPPLDEKTKERIFHPGYTTKTDGEHSGLGLAIVMERAKHYGGTVDLQSDEENGTVFRVTIPQRDSRTE